MQAVLMLLYQFWMELWPEMLWLPCQQYPVAQPQVTYTQSTTLNCRDKISSPGGEDYTDVTITLTFGAAVLTQLATVPIIDDNMDEDTEFFSLALTSTDNAAMLNPATATVSIKDSKLTIWELQFQYNCILLLMYLWE